jgi:hypothetical protein
LISLLKGDEDAMKMNAELKKIVGRVKDAQQQLQGLVQDQTWVEEARKYAERQGKEVKKLITSDVKKVRTFLEKERKELERFQKQIPSEVKKLRKFVDGQRKELEKLIATTRKVGLKEAVAKTQKSRSKKAAAPKKSAAPKKTSKKVATPASSEASAQA